MMILQIAEVERARAANGMLKIISTVVPLSAFVTIIKEAALIFALATHHVASFEYGFLTQWRGGGVTGSGT
jgi:hypothetical protein